MKAILCISIITLAFINNAFSQSKAKAKQASQQTTYYQYNGLGSVAALTDMTGNAVEKYSYDVFGAPSIKDANENPVEASGFGNRYMFAGREYLKDIGQYDYRNRIYSPGIGRFQQTDPIGFNSGDANLYNYCSNNPITFTDPTGEVMAGGIIINGSVVGSGTPVWHQYYQTTTPAGGITYLYAYGSGWAGNGTSNRNNYSSSQSAAVTGTGSWSVAGTAATPPTAGMQLNLTSSATPSYVGMNEPKLQQEGWVIRIGGGWDVGWDLIYAGEPGAPKSSSSSKTEPCE